MCGSSSSSPHSCSRVIFPNASQAAGFSTRSSEGEGRGGGWKRTEDGKGRGFDSPVVSFFSPPWLAPYQATFFSQLFNDERASRRRCCLSSAAHKSCAKLARRTPSAFFPFPLRTTLLDGNPRYLGKLQLCISFHGQANFTILFRARSTNREGLRQSRNPWTLEKLEDEVSLRKENRRSKIGKKGETSSGICLGEERFTREQLFIRFVGGGCSPRTGENRMRLIRAKLFDLGIRSIYTPFHLIVFLEYNYYDRDVISRGE